MPYQCSNSLKKKNLFEIAILIWPLREQRPVCFENRTVCDWLIRAEKVRQHHPSSHYWLRPIPLSQVVLTSGALQPVPVPRQVRRAGPAGKKFWIKQGNYIDKFQRVKDCLTWIDSMPVPTVKAFRFIPSRWHETKCFEYKIYLRRINWPRNHEWIKLRLESRSIELNLLMLLMFQVYVSSSSNKISIPVMMRHMNIIENIVRDSIPHDKRTKCFHTIIISAD